MCLESCAPFNGLLQQRNCKCCMLTCALMVAPACLLGVIVGHFWLGGSGCLCEINGGRGKCNLLADGWGSVVVLWRAAGRSGYHALKGDNHLGTASVASCTKMVLLFLNQVDTESYELTMNTPRDGVILTFGSVQVYYMNMCLCFHCSLALQAATWACALSESCGSHVAYLPLRSIRGKLLTLYSLAPVIFTVAPQRQRHISTRELRVTLIFIFPWLGCAFHVSITKGHCICSESWKAMSHRCTSIYSTLADSQHLATSIWPFLLYFYDLLAYDQNCWCIIWWVTNQ